MRKKWRKKFLRRKNTQVVKRSLIALYPQEVPNARSSKSHLQEASSQEDKRFRYFHYHGSARYKMPAGETGVEQLSHTCNTSK